MDPEPGPRPPRAAIISQLSAACSFFILLSWLPTFFKETFPSSKVGWLPGSSQGWGAPRSTRRGALGSFRRALAALPPPGSAAAPGCTQERPSCCRGCLPVCGQSFLGGGRARRGCDVGTDVSCWSAWLTAPQPPGYPPNSGDRGPLAAHSGQGAAPQLCPAGCGEP